MIPASQEKPSTNYDVLVVEDDDDCREVLSSLLCDEGYRVKAAASGAEALDVLAEMNGPPRLLLLDLVMPGMSGYEFLQTMRRAPSLAGVPVVIHSGLVEDPTVDPPPGVACWLRKPVQVDALLDVARHFAK